MEELVFAIPTNELWKLITYKEQGFIKADSEVLARIIQKGLFRKRVELEEDPSFKQIIPYAIISNNGSFFLFRRTSKQQEKLNEAEAVKEWATKEKPKARRVQDVVFSIDNMRYK